MRIYIILGLCFLFFLTTLEAFSEDSLYKKRDFFSKSPKDLNVRKNDYEIRDPKVSEVEVVSVPTIKPVELEEVKKKKKAKVFESKSIKKKSVKDQKEEVNFKRGESIDLKKFEKVTNKIVDRASFLIGEVNKETRDIRQLKNKGHKKGKEKLKVKRRKESQSLRERIKNIGS